MGEFLNGFLGVSTETPPTSTTTAFLEENADCDTHWLKEFRGQLCLIPEFAKSVHDHMTSHEDFQVAEVEPALSEFLVSCGKGVFSVNGIQQWIELMACTGLLHGATLSATRLLFTHAGRPFFQPEPDTFTERVLLNITLGFGTIVGLTPGRDVFTNIQLEENIGLMRVIGEYTQKSFARKDAYKKSIDLTSEEFLLHGWLLTDYFPALDDNKQLTMTSYV